jgi:hypothetical protein
VIKNTTLFSKKLIQGTGWVNAEVEREFEALGVAIDKFGEKIKAQSNKIYIPSPS